MAISAKSCAKFNDGNLVIGISGPNPQIIARVHPESISIYKRKDDGKYHGSNNNVVVADLSEGEVVFYVDILMFDERFIKEHYEGEW